MKKNKDFNQFKEIVSYEYENVIIEKNIGDEKRTFFILDKEKPLLSPSRVKKIFTEHIFWNIPERNIFRPRMMGKLIHLGIEYFLLNDVLTIYSIKDIEKLLGAKEEVLWNSWKIEEQELFKYNVNLAIDKIGNWLLDNKIKVLAVEKHIANQTFHGFPDILATMDDDKELDIPIIIDLKTSSQEFKNLGEYKSQLGIYNDILENICRTFILHYHTKTETIQFVEIKEIEPVIKTIKDLIKIYE